MTDIKNKYPKSINNKQCIGPCYIKGTKHIIHPLTLGTLRDTTQTICPVLPFVDKITKKELTYDVCKYDINNTQTYNTIDMVTPTIDITSDYFIEQIYGIHNFEALLTWFNNNKDCAYITKERVFNNGMVLYGSDIHIIDQRFVDHITYILYYNISKIYKSIRMYINVNIDTVELINPIYISDKYNNHNDDKHIIQLIRNYIKTTFLDTETIYQYISKFIRYYKNNLSDVHITVILVEKMIEYIIKRINISFE